MFSPDFSRKYPRGVAYNRCGGSDSTPENLESLCAGANSYQGYASALSWAPNPMAAEASIAATAFAGG